MSIFDRMSKVISSRLHGVVDALENQSKLHSLNVQELEDALKQAKSEVIRVVSESKVLSQNMQTMEAEFSTWQKRAELAISQGEEALAREALIQKKRVQDKLKRLEETYGIQMQTALSMKKELERMESKMEEFRARASSLMASEKVAHLKEKFGEATENVSSVVSKSGFGKWKNIETKIETKEMARDAEAEVEEALASGRGPNETELEQSFAKLEREELLANAKRGGAAETNAPNSPNAPLATPEIESELQELKNKFRI